MTRVSARRSVRGQGLAEYALIIALAALVTIIAIGLVSLAVQRGFGVVGGALGAKKGQGEGGGQTLVIDTDQLPRCGYLPSQNSTGLYAQFYSSVDPSQVLVSTDTGIMGSVDHAAGSETETCSPSSPCLLAVIQMLKINAHDDSVCPHSIVVQTTTPGGPTVLYPVETRDW